MKTYKVPELKKLAADQGYKMAALEGPQGEKIFGFNPIKSNINKQLDLIPVRFRSELNPDGIYFVLMAHGIQHAKNPHRFPIAKGKVNPEELKEAEKRSLPVTHAEILPAAQNVLTWDGALKMQQEISDLRTQVARLTLEKENLEKELAEYEAEESLAEADQDQGTGNTLLSGLKDLAANFTPVLDRYFDLEEKKIALQEKKITGASGAKHSASPKAGQRVAIVTGSKDHLSLIEHYFTTEEEDKLNRELDKLQVAYPDIYAQVCTRLWPDGMDNQEEEEEEENDGQ